MKNLSNLDINEAETRNVYVVYFKDGTMYNYFNTKEEAQEQADELNSESEINGAEVKQEPITNFEKKS